MTKQSAAVKNLTVVKSVSETLSEAEGTDANQVEGRTELTEDPAESEQPKGRADGRQPIEVSAPRGFFKGAAIAYHFAESVSQETAATILNLTETALAEAVEAAGLKMAVTSHTYHLTARIGSEADLSKPVSKSSGPRVKVLSVETFESFQNAVKAETSKLIKAGTFDAANRPAAKRAALLSLMADWNTDRETVARIAGEYMAAQTADEADEE